MLDAFQFEFMRNAVLAALLATGATPHAEAA